MLRILLFGVLASLFFSSTFVLNRAMALEGGHWAWSASLRYFWMIGILGFLGWAGTALTMVRLVSYVKVQTRS